MKCLTVIKDSNIDLSIKTIKREAARGIIIKNNKVLMIHSKYFDDYTFPGGGLENEESIEETLFREMREEVGATNLKIISSIGYVDEYRSYYSEVCYNLFQRSHFFICTSDKFIDPQLESYEIKHGYESVWVDIEQAIEHNKSQKNQTTAKRREIFMLEYLKKQSSYRSV